MNVLSMQTIDTPDPAPEPFSVAAVVSLQERRYRTIKSGDTFGVLDHGGDILCLPGGTDGLYHKDTRHLSRFDLMLNGIAPLLLSSTLGMDNVMLTSDFANASAVTLGEPDLDQGVIHVRRSLFLDDDACHIRLAVRNFAFSRRRVHLQFRFDSDFADLFEVRGMRRDRRGQLLPSMLSDDGVTLSYRGLDGLRRATSLSFEPAPQSLSPGSASFDLDLEPRGRATIFVHVSFAADRASVYRPRAAFLAAFVQTKRILRASTARTATISSPHEEFDETLRRCATDLRMLVTNKPTGPYPYAGIPWFSTVFGRDALITALLTLALDPALSAGVLRYLAQEQATEVDPSAEAEPGKILHEMRGGEMAELREVPFRRYYGSVDSTPLFVMLAGAYLDRTDDIATLEELWPHIELALGWIDRRVDADGFVGYCRSTEDGLANQGWKDSYDSISHEDGSLARGMISLCEVQGYVYAARLAGAAIAWRLGLESETRAQQTKAEHLRVSFEERFWCERLGTYALALDGEGKQCQVRSSNAGQLLMTGIAAPARARQVAQGLMDAGLFTGWGIRTLATTEARYNPMSYHNGSVWPHDNAMIALGLARIGLRKEAVRLFEAIYAASSAMDMRRLPELFCGFPRRPRQGPTSYPVACSPQAWAAASLPAFVQACLGLSFDPVENAVRFNRPSLPAFLNSLTLHNLSLGTARVSVRISRMSGEVSVSVIERDGEDPIQVITTI